MKSNDITSDKPRITPGKITWGDLYALQKWEQSHGISSITKSDIDDYREEGYRAIDAGLQLGLIDYAQATGCET